MSVVEAVAAASDVSPMQVTPRLSDTLDPDALDRLFATRRGGGRRSEGSVLFEMGNWRVRVDWSTDSVCVFEATGS